MKWSWRIGRAAGIDIYIHATFLILIAWIAISHYVVRSSGLDVLDGLLFLFSLFAIIVLHELGHALTARRFGIKTHDITLLPIGGVARLERMPEDPKQEFLVAIAGPAVNVVLAILFALITIPIWGLESITDLKMIGGPLLPKLVWVNITLTVFNMLPAFPMDGGRVLRAFLAMGMNYVHATRIAAGIGQAMALMFGLIGIFNPPLFMLTFVALFIWMGAAQESRMVRMKAELGGVPVQHAMITEFHALSPDDSLARPVEYILAGFQQDFPVVEDGQLVGMLARADVMKALSQHGHAALVRDVMHQAVETAEPAESLDTVVARLQRFGRSIPILQRGELVGMLTLENIAEFLMIRSAMRTFRT